MRKRKGTRQQALRKENQHYITKPKKNVCVCVWERERERAHLGRGKSKNQSRPTLFACLNIIILTYGFLYYFWNFEDKQYNPIQLAKANQQKIKIKKLPKSFLHFFGGKKNIMFDVDCVLLLIYFLFLLGWIPNNLAYKLFNALISFLSDQSTN